MQIRIQATNTCWLPATTSDRLPLVLVMTAPSSSTKTLRRTWRVVAAAPITANDTIGLSYSRGSVDIDEGETYDAKGWGVSYSHAMSKRTNVYATYGQMSQDNELNNHPDYSFALEDSYERAFRVGMRHFF